MSTEGKKAYLFDRRMLTDINFQSTILRFPAMQIIKFDESKS